MAEQNAEAIPDVFVVGCWFTGASGTGSDTGIVIDAASGADVELTGCYVTDPPDGAGLRLFGLSIVGSLPEGAWRL